MKNLVKIFIAIISIALISSSCSVEKRVYMSGYHVKWNKTFKKDDRNFNDIVSAKNLKEEKICTVANKNDVSVEIQDSVCLESKKVETKIEKENLIASCDKNVLAIKPRMKKPFSEQYESNKKNNEFLNQNAKEENTSSRRRGGVLAILSLICGIIGLIGFLVITNSFLWGIAAIVLGIIALVERSGNPWMAIVGIILGMLATGILKFKIG